jgi:hypothetical protein
VETKSGPVFQGVLKQSTTEKVQIMGIDGNLVSVRTAEVKEKSAMQFRSCQKGCTQVSRFRSSRTSLTI